MPVYKKHPIESQYRDMVRLTIVFWVLLVVFYALYGYTTLWPHSVENDRTLGTMLGLLLLPLGLNMVCVGFIWIRISAGKVSLVNGVPPRPPREYLRGSMICACIMTACALGTIYFSEHLDHPTKHPIKLFSNTATP